MVVGRPIRSVRAVARKKPPRGNSFPPAVGTFASVLSGAAASFFGAVTSSGGGSPNFRYVTQTGRGLLNGSDWNNSMPWPASFTRGLTYYIADGNYGSPTLSTPTSGTQPITIKKATAADHGTETGWVATDGDGVATFGTITVATQYWIINGATRTETTVMEAPAGYGIRCTSLAGNDAFVDGDTASNSQFSYMDIGGTWSTTIDCSAPNSALRFVYVHHHLTFTRCIFHNAGVGNGAMCMMHGTADITFDHCDFYIGWGKATVATPNVGQQRHTTKFCRFWNAAQVDTCPGAEGAGITTELGTYSHTSTTDGHLVYGCVFYGTASGGRNAVVWYGNNFDPLTATNCKAFNNTFVGFPESPVFAHIYLLGSGNEARNNLFWDVAGAMEVTANAASNNVDATVNPFVAGGYPTTLDFRISSTSQARNAGTDVGAPYNVDPLGTTRTAGSWDAGAYEYA